MLLTKVSNEIIEHIPLRSSVKPSDTQIMVHLLDKTRYKLNHKPLPPGHCWKCGKVENSDSELKLMKCVRCMTALYCDKTCQTNHWTNSHKYCCKLYSTYSSIISEIKQSLDNMAKYLFEFVSTDEEEDNDDEEDVQETETTKSTRKMESD